MMMARVHTASTSSRMWVEMMIAFSLAISLDQLADLVLLVGIEAVGRLVHDQHLGVVQDRLRQADAALEALGEGLDGAVEHRLEPGVCSTAMPARRVASCFSKPRMPAMNCRSLRGVISA